MHSYITREKRRTVLNRHTHTHKYIYKRKYTHMNEKNRNKLKHSVYFKLLTFEI